MIETPASVPSSAARGVILRITGPTKSPQHQHKTLDKYPGSPASQPLIGSPVESAIGSMITKVTTNMCGTLIPEGKAENACPVCFAKR